MHLHQQETHLKSDRDLRWLRNITKVEKLSLVKIAKEDENHWLD